MASNMLALSQSDKLYMNLTQVLNITSENLTSLLLAVQGNDEHGLQTPGPNPTPMTLLVMLTVGYALIFIAGVLGNLITCIVISKNNFMHTATNFYLFNLAISDLILLCSGMPQDLYNLWHPDNYPFTDGICVLESVLSETAANATVLTITAFTVERYIAICHPFRQHTMSKLSRAIKFIFAIWITALLLALPQAIQFSVVTYQYQSISCTINDNFFVHVFAVSGFLFFGGPMTAICVLYVLIGVKLKRSRLLQALPRRSFDIHRGISAQTRVIRMLVAVAVAFFICWAPFHAQRLMAAYGSTSGVDSQLFNDIFSVLNYASGVLYFLSTCINPLLYNIMSHKFREAFKVTLARHCRCSSKYQGHGQGLPPNYSVLRRRQHGSMRTTVNTNVGTGGMYGSYRSVQFRCRDQSQRLSLQDSIRTTTTTTTINGSGSGSGSGGSSSTGPNNGNGSVRCPQRQHRVSLDGSHATLLSSQSRQDLYANAAPPNHRMLQTQISQLSSVGDAQSLLEVEIDGNYRNRPGSNNPTNTNTSNLIEGSHCWPEDDEYELAARHRPTMCSIAESGSISVVNSRPRLKLTRITRPPSSDQQHQPTSGTTSNTTTTSINASANGNSISGKVHKAKVKGRSNASTTLKSLKAKFNWRTRRKDGRATTAAATPLQSTSAEKRDAF